jgi:hypothetical protein
MGRKRSPREIDYSPPFAESNQSCHFRRALQNSFRSLITQIRKKDSTDFFFIFQTVCNPCNRFTIGVIRDFWTLQKSLKIDKTGRIVVKVDLGFVAFHAKLLK